MRTTVTIDDKLVASAQEYTGIQEKSALINEALKRLGRSLAPTQRRDDPTARSGCHSAASNGDRRDCDGQHEGPRPLPPKDVGIAARQYGGHDQVMGMVERERLFSTGISYIDAHLLASALITPEARLWTRDRRLREAAERLDVSIRPWGKD